MQTTKFYSLFSGAFLLFFGYGLFLNSSSIKLAEMGVSDVVIGLLNAAFFVGATLSTVFAHRLVSAVGHIRSFSVFSAVFAISALSHLLWENLWLWGGLRIALGFCHYSLLLLIESWMSEKTNIETRGKTLAAYNLIFYLAFIGGAGLLGLVLKSEHIFTFSAILVMMSMIPIALTRMVQPDIPKPERISLPRLFVISPLALAGSFISGMLVNGFFTMASVFMLKLSFNLSEISLYLMMSMLGGFFSQVPIALLSDKFGRRNTILSCALLATLSALIGIFANFLPNSTAYLQYLLAFLLGCSLFTLYALSIARANDELPNNMNTVEVSRGILFCYGMGALVAPPLIGLAITLSEMYGFYTFFALFSAVLALFAGFTRRVAKEQRSEIQLTTPIATATTVDEIQTAEQQDTLIPLNDELIQQYQETYLSDGGK